MTLELRFEGEERQALHALFKSKGWKIVFAEIEGLKSKNRDYAMNEIDSEELLRRQGYDWALDTMLKLERIMLEEERLEEAARVDDLSRLRARGG